MEMDERERYRIGASLLMGFAFLLLIAGLLTDQWRYMQTPLFMLSTTCFIGGVFLFVFGGGESIDARLASRLSLQGIPALGRIIRNLGGYGVAIFLPPDGPDGKVMQFIPTQPACRPFFGDGGGFAYHDGSTGTVAHPLAGPVLEDLKRDNELVLPSDYGLLMGAIREVCEDLLSIADRVDIRRDGDTVIVHLHNYLLYSGCAALRKESPEVCILCPCSICSLIACMIAEGLKCEVNLNCVTQDDPGRSPGMVIRYTLKMGTDELQS
jgi:hypothetical protein